MNRALLYTLITFLLIILFALLTFFTPFGSDTILKSVANSYLKNKIKDQDIKITKLLTTPSSIKSEILVDNDIVIKVEGPINWLKRIFNLKYSIDADKVKVKQRKLAVKMHIKGSLEGKVDLFKVLGKGRAFDSGLNYNFVVANKKILNINAQLYSARVSKILALLKEPPYADGLVTLNIDMPSLNPNNPTGNAHLLVKNGKINKYLIKKDFNIEIVGDGKFTLDANSEVKNKVFITNANLNTNLGKISLKRVINDALFNKFRGDYIVDIKDLKPLSKIAKTKLQGAFKTTGLFFINREKNFFQLLGATKSFKGNLIYRYESNRAKIKLANVSIPSILYHLSQPPLLKSGLISGKIDVKNIKELEGGYKIISNGILNKKILKKLYDIKVPNSKFKVISNGDLKKGTLRANSTIISPLAILKLQKSIFNIPTTTYKSQYIIKIPNLASFGKLLPTPMQGKIKVAGAIKGKNSNFSISGVSTSLGGKSRFNITSNKAFIKLSSVSIDKILYILKNPQYTKKAILNGELKLNSLKNLNGTLTISSKGALNRKVLKKLYNIELPKNSSYSLSIKRGVFKNGTFKANPTFKSALGNIKLINLKYNIKKDTLKSEYKLYIPNLANLESLIGRKLNGNLALSGTIKRKNLLYVDGRGAKFNGAISFVYNEPLLNASVTSASAIEILKTLDLPKILKAKTNAKLKYNVKSKKGEAKVSLRDAQLFPNKFTQALKDLIHFDLSKEIFRDGNLSAKIDNEKIKYNFNATSQKTKMRVKDGKFNTKTKKVDMLLFLTYKNHEYPVKIYGIVGKNLSIVPDLGKILKDKLEGKLKKIIDKKVKSKIKIEDKIKNVDEKVKEKAKELIKKLF